MLLILSKSWFVFSCSQVIAYRVSKISSTYFRTSWTYNSTESKAILQICFLKNEVWHIAKEMPSYQKDVTVVL